MRKWNHSRHHENQKRVTDVSSFYFVNLTFYTAQSQQLRQHDKTMENQLDVMQSVFQNSGPATVQQRALNFP